MEKLLKSPQIGKKRDQLSALTDLRASQENSHAIQKVSLHPRDSKTIILILNRNHTRPKRAPHNTNFLYTLSYLAHTRGELLEHSPLSIHHDQKGWPVIPPPSSTTSLWPALISLHIIPAYISFNFFYIYSWLSVSQSPLLGSYQRGRPTPSVRPYDPLCRRPPQLLGI